MFIELSQQANKIFPIPPQAYEVSGDILLPFLDTEKEEERKEKLYTKPFTFYI